MSKTQILACVEMGGFWWFHRDSFESAGFQFFSALAWRDGRVYAVFCPISTFTLPHNSWIVSDSAFIIHKYIPCSKTFFFCTKVKVKYQGHIFKKTAVTGALVFHKLSLFCFLSLSSKASIFLWKLWKKKERNVIYKPFLFLSYNLFKRLLSLGC